MYKKKLLDSVASLPVSSCRGGRIPISYKSTIIVTVKMKSTTMAIALVLLYVLIIILPDVNGTRRPVGHPRPVMRPDQAVGAHPGPIMRRERAPVPHHPHPGDFRQTGRMEQAGRVVASRARYARAEGSAVLPAGVDLGTAINLANDGIITLQAVGTGVGSAAGVFVTTIDATQSSTGAKLSGFGNEATKTLTATITAVGGAAGGASQGTNGAGRRRRDEWRLQKTAN